MSLDPVPAPLSPAAEVWSRYATFLAAPPELVLEWQDPESTARGWLVINSLRGGAAGGGTRMRAGLGRDEVLFLAKAMELKFSVAGPPIGGAKSGIDFPPGDPRKAEVLARWFQTIRPLIESCYATAGDLNVDEMREVVPACVEVGLLHPQQGVARGHLGLTGEALARRLRTMRSGLEARLGEGLGLAGVDLRLSDVVTGFGVAVATLRLCERRGRSLEGARVLLEGFGRVGGAAALYLSRWGARIVGIVDAVSALTAEDGLSPERVESLLGSRLDNRLPVDSSPADMSRERERFGKVEAEVLVCAAASGTVDAERLDRLAAQGVEAIVSGANRPFAASFPGDASLERTADDRFAIVADFIANCGSAHAFACLVSRDEPADPRAVLDSVEMTICRGLDETVARAGGAERGLLAGALGAALDRVSAQEP